MLLFLAEVTGSPPGEYGQEIPMRRPNEKHSGPPILPPHLLQVILNKDTPVHVSTSVRDTVHDQQFSHPVLSPRRFFSRPVLGRKKLIHG